MSKQYKVTHEEAALLELALMSIDWRIQDGRTKDQIHGMVSVANELQKRMHDLAKDRRSGRTSDTCSDGTLSLRCACNRLHKKYFGSKLPDYV